MLLKEIRKNNIREQEVQKNLEKEDEQTQEDNRIACIKGKIYVPNNQKIQEQILQEIMNQHIREQAISLKLQTPTLIIMDFCVPMNFLSQTPSLNFLVQFQYLLQNFIDFLTPTQAISILNIHHISSISLTSFHTRTIVHICDVSICYF